MLLLLQVKRASSTAKKDIDHINKQMIKVEKIIKELEQYHI